VLNYAAATECQRSGDDWRVTLSDRVRGATLAARARVVVNAAGPHADPFSALAGVQTAHRHVLSKGVHIVVPAVTASEHVLASFGCDGRPFFVIPMGDCSCIGTTDTVVMDPDVAVTEEDRDFLLQTANRRLALDRPLAVTDIIAERCGVRPLAVGADVTTAGDWLTMSRRHEIDIDADSRSVTVLGGKLTDCLNVGEEVVAATAALLGSRPGSHRMWYGEASDDVRAQVMDAPLGDEARAVVIESPDALRERLWRHYGGGAAAVLARFAADPLSAEPAVAGFPLTVAELCHAVSDEYALYQEDILRRRSLLALTRRPSVLAAASRLQTVLAQIVLA
jgi:glycerol-3-phosphate dehydrogenase